MNLQPQLHNSKLLSRWNRFIALAVAGMYGASSTIASTIALSLLNSNVLASAGLAQPIGDVTPSALHLDQTAQLPGLPPAPPTSPTPQLWETDTPNPDGINFYAPPPPLGYPEQQQQETPAPQFNVYRLGIGDSIAVTVPRFPDLSFQSTIDIEGNIFAPLLGKVQVTGLTLEGIQAKIRENLNKFVVDPQVEVSLTGTRPAQITISGEVVRPGYYTLQPGVQIASVLLAAGGATNEGDLRTIIVRRKSIVDNSFNEQRIDIFTPLQNGTSLPDFRLQDGDAVIVPKLDVATLQDYDRGLISRSTLAQPQITIRVLSYANERIGNITLPNGSTFVDALASIAPNPDRVKFKDIALIRFDPEAGKTVTQHLNGRRALLGDISQDVPLQDDDVIVVGRNLIGRLTYALNLITEPITTAFGFRSFITNFEALFGGSNTNQRR